MSVYHTKQVDVTIYRYEETLNTAASVYYRSKKRRKEKLQKLLNFLKSLGKKSIKGYPICTKIDLGQIIEDGVCINKALRVAYYKDESNTQWSVSFFRNSDGDIIIYRLLQSANVKESKRKTVILTEKQINMLLGNMKEDK